MAFRSKPASSAGEEFELKPDQARLCQTAAQRAALPVKPWNPQTKPHLSAAERKAEAEANEERKESRSAICSTARKADSRPVGS